MSYFSRGPKPPARRVTVAEIWEIGREQAKQPNRMTRIKHSGFVRRNRKPGAIAKNIVTAAGELIPIPILATALGEITDKAIAAVKQRSLSKKIDRYSGDGWESTKKVKHEIKKLNVEELDRSRAKVVSAIKDVNAIAQNHSWIHDENYCDYRTDVAESYHYLEKRINLLEERAAVFEAVGKAAKEWANTQREALDKAKLACDKRMDANEDVVFHRDCSSVCVKPQARSA